MASVALAGFGLGLLLAAQVGPVTLLIVVDARSAWAGLRARAGFELPEEVAGPRRAFLTAVAATALNPLTIALWTMSFPAAAPRSAWSSTGNLVALLAGVALGTSTWYCGFSTAVALLRARVGERLLRVVDVGIGCGLVGFGAVLAYRSASDA